MNRSKKLCIIMMTFILAALLFSSCGDSQKGETSHTSGGSDAAANVTEAVQETTETLITDDLAAADYNKRTFTFITGSEVHWGLLDRMCVESETGEIINDATFRRTIKVEDRFNVNIEDVKIPYHQIGDRLKKSVTAGDRSYDGVYMWGMYFLDLAAGGYLYDLNGLPNVNFSKPYWDENAKNQLSVDDKLFMMTGDGNMFYNDATWVIMFNKTMLGDYELEDPYKLVRDGKWTLDKMMEMGKACIKDVDGDGKFGRYDQYGLATHSETISGAFYATGEKLFVKNAEDIPEFNAGSERCLQALEKVYELFSRDTNITYDVTNPANVNDAGFDALQHMFEANQSLFCGEVLECVRRYREMETPFGLLPLPKLDENQEDYYSYIIYAFTGACVPRNIGDDAEFVGTILEAMQSESYYTLVPAYFDVALDGKFFRDEESREMLNIILGNRSYPFEILKDFGGLMATLKSNISKGKTDFASAIESSESKATTEISKLIEKIEALG